MITYEWVAEEYDEYGDIIDPMFGDTLKEVMGFIEPASNVKYALVRNDGDEEEGLSDRQYAYIDDFELPAYLDGGATVPSKYRKEAATITNQKRLRDYD